MSKKDSRNSYKLIIDTGAMKISAAIQADTRPEAIEKARQMFGLSKREALTKITIEYERVSA